MMHWFWPGSNGMGVIWMLLMAGVWVAIIVGIIFLIRSATWGGGKRAQETPSVVATPPAVSAAKGSPEALRILEERYARGDIEREEFLQRRSDLLS
jgi:putative membrane protein